MGLWLTQVLLVPLARHWHVCCPSRSDHLAIEFLEPLFPARVIAVPCCHVQVAFPSLDPIRAKESALAVIAFVESSAVRGHRARPADHLFFELMTRITSSVSTTPLPDIGIAPRKLLLYAVRQRLGLTQTLPAMTVKSDDFRAQESLGTFLLVSAGGPNRTTESRAPYPVGVPAPGRDDPSRGSLDNHTCGRKRNGTDVTVAHASFCQ